MNQTENVNEINNKKIDKTVEHIKYALFLCELMLYKLDKKYSDYDISIAKLTMQNKNYKNVEK